MTVAIRKSNNIRRSFEEIFEELNFQPGKRVFIKPNLCGRVPIKKGENTSIVVMDALVSFLIDMGSIITIGHGTLLASSSSIVSYLDTLKQSGFVKYITKNRVSIINIDDLDRNVITCENMTYHLPLDYFQNEVDTYINLAKLKTHMETKVSFSLKNQMGIPIPDDRIRMHRNNLERSIAHLGTLLKPDLSILEAYPAMEKNGPHHGQSRNLQLLLACTDMVELDSFACFLIGINPDEVNHVKFATEFGVGRQMIQNKADSYECFLVPDFKQANTRFKFGTKMYGYPNYSCSRCITAVNNAGNEFKKHPFQYARILYHAFFSKININVIFGKADNLTVDTRDKNICIGKCTKEFALRNGTTYLDKCPPTVNEVIDFISQNPIGIL